MLNMTSTAPLYLYTGVADMRKSFDGLMGLIAQAGMADQAEVLSGAWFIFRNRRGDRIKILYFDRDGLAIWYKRLERGRFQWPRLQACSGQQPASVIIEPDELAMILAGIDLNSAQRRKRWRKPESAMARNAVENASAFDTLEAYAMMAATAHDTASSHHP